MFQHCWVGEEEKVRKIRKVNSFGNAEILNEDCQQIRIFKNNSFFCSTVDFFSHKMRLLKNITKFTIFFSNKSNIKIHMLSTEFSWKSGNEKKKGKNFFTLFHSIILIISKSRQVT